PEMVRAVRRGVSEEGARGDRLELDAEADRLPVLLEDRLRALAHGVYGGLVEDLELDAALGAHAVGALDPTVVVELLVGGRDVELADVKAGGVLRVHRLGRGKDVARRLAREPVAIELRRDCLAVRRHRERAADMDISEERVLGAGLAAVVAERRVRVREVDHQTLDARPVDSDEVADTRAL